MLADACRGLEIPVFAVLGNHDWHLNRRTSSSRCSTDAGVRVLERSSARVEVGGARVGVVGAEGLRRRLPRPRAAGLRRAAPAPGLRRDDRRRRGARPRARRRSTTATCGSSPPLRADDDDPRGRAAGDLGVPRHRPPGGARSPRTARPRPARPRARRDVRGLIGGVPVYNVAAPVTGRTSGCSSSGRRSGRSRPTVRGGARGVGKNRTSVGPGGRRPVSRCPTLYQPVMGLAPHNLNDPAAVALQDPVRGRAHAARCRAASSAFRDRDRLAGRAEQHRHAVRMAICPGPCPRGRCSRCGGTSHRARSRVSRGTSRRSIWAKSSRKPCSNSFTRTQQVVCGE